MDTIMAIIASMGHERDINLEKFKQSPLFYKVQTEFRKNNKLTFILPAFPAKSSNRNKTHGPLPDMGEVLALKRLQEMCSAIKEHYSPGAEVIICSDGRVFNDLVFVSNDDLKQYDISIKKIIHDFKLSHLKTYSLDDYDSKNGKQSLIERFAPDVKSIKTEIKTNPNSLSMFNGIHRFIKDDLAFNNIFISKNQLHRESKAIAYQVISRSRAWDKLLEEVFPGTLRLSIHPYPIEHHKFGIELVSAKDRWATPWHNVALKVSDSFKLVKRIDALRIGAKAKMFEGAYAYYEA